MKSLTLPSIAAAILAVSVISIVRSQPQSTSTNPPLPPPSSTFPDCVAAVGLIEPKSENIAIGVPLSALVEKVFVPPAPPSPKPRPSSPWPKVSPPPPPVSAARK